MANIADLNNNIKLTATPPPLQKKENKFFLPPDNMTLSDTRGYTIIWALAINLPN